MRYRDMIFIEFKYAFLSRSTVLLIILFVSLAYYLQGILINARDILLLNFDTKMIFLFSMLFSLEYATILAIALQPFYRDKISGFFDYILTMPIDLWKIICLRALIYVTFSLLLSFVFFGLVILPLNLEIQLIDALALFSVSTILLLGLVLVMFYTQLVVSDPRWTNLIFFFMIFGIVRLPSLTIENKMPASTLLALLFIIGIALIGTTIYLLCKINPERIVLH